MKKTLLTLFAVAALFNLTKAQVSAYPFAQTSGTYTPITGGTSIANGTADDNVYGAMNIGFTFNYNGINYTQFGLNVNGWISMGSTTPSGDYYPISGGATNNIISAMGQDLQLGFTSTGDYTTGSNIITNVGSTTGFVVGDVLLTSTGFATGTTITAVGSTTLTVSTNATATATSGTYTVEGSIRYQTIGTAPNQTCVIQWTRTRRYGTGASSGQNDLFNFQIRLSQTTNTVTFVYGLYQTNTAPSQYEIGLRGSSNADFNNRETATDWSATTAGTVNTDVCGITATVKPASGQTYTWTTPAACTGTPTAGTASAPTAACSGVDFDLVLTGYTSGSGITFQWQSSPTLSGTYTNISGAITSTFTTSQTATTYYQCVVTCGGSSATTTAIGVTMNTPANCYCAAVNGGTSCITNVTLNTLNRTSAGCENSPNYYTQVPVGTATTTISKGLTYPLSVSIDNSAGAILSVWIDYNQNGTFEASEWNQIATNALVSSTSTVNVLIPSTALSGQTAMRIRSRNTGNLNGSGDACLSMGSGETEDYIVTIGTATACTGTPTAGTASAPTAVCSGVNFDLVLTGYTPGVSGLTFQWQSSSTLSGTYTNISGATTSTFTTSQTTTTYYQCVVTCSGSSATTTAIGVTMNAAANCFSCTSTATSTNDEEIFNVTVGTLNNSSTCATTGGTGSVLNQYSNYITVAAPSLARNSSVAFSVQTGTCGTGSYPNAFKIFIDYNQNGSFAEAGERVYTSDTTLGAHTDAGNFTVPLAATLGNTLMRVVCTETSYASSIDSCGTYTWGETEDYLVNITTGSGIEENAVLNSISIYPNPTTGLFNITTNNANFTQLAISVIDIQGKEVFNASDKNSSSNYNKQINLEGLSKGLYYIKLNTGNGVKIQKLIIQ